MQCTSNVIYSSKDVLHQLIFFSDFKIMFSKAFKTLYHLKGLVFLNDKAIICLEKIK